MLRGLLLLVALVHLSHARDEYHGSVRGSARAEAGAAAAAAAAEEAGAAYWRAEAAAAIQRRRLQNRAVPRGRARRLVMFLGDGMSMPTLAAARTLLGQRRGRPGEEASLAFEDFPTVGLAKTYCVDAQIADSACTATSYLCGAKTNMGMLGLRAAAARGNCSAAADEALWLSSIAAWALDAGMDAGIVTTARVTHASPGGTYAHSAERNWESDADLAEACAGAAPAQDDIAVQLVHHHPGNQFKVILGGGRREFIPNTTVDEEGAPGRRLDGRNLIEEWRSDKSARNASHAYVWNRRQLMRQSLAPPEYLLGLFEDSHMQYHLEANPDTEPTLAELTEIAIRALDRNENGFFLFVEGGRIDHAHHDNYVQLALDETIEMAAAVARARELLPSEEALLVVTADHAHVMAFSGYAARGGDVLGASGERDADGAPYMTLSYANGPGARASPDARSHMFLEDDYGTPRWRSHAEVPRELETHGGEDVAVFASGPHHDLFGGLYEQSQLPHLMAYAGCFGPKPHACDDD